MKFIKKMSDFKNQKVMFGLFAVLFMGSIVQTGAILKSQSSNQAAQVILNTGPTKSCLSVTHLYNQSEFFYNGPDFSQPGDYYRFRGVYRVKNNCAFGVKILDTDQYSQNIAKLQGLSWNGNPADLNLTDETVFPNSQWAPAETVDCLNCFSPSDSAQSYPVSSQSSPTINAFPLSSGQERDYIVTKYVSVYDSNNFSNLYQNYIRVMVNGIKYFKDSALSDGVVSSSEVATSLFTSSEKEMYVGDYVKFIHNGDYSGMAGEDSNIKDATKEGATEKEASVR